MSSCRGCDVGKDAPGRGRRECDQCSPGRYASIIGTQSCAECVFPYTSQQGSSTCDNCHSGYFYHTLEETCRKCPEGGSCPFGTTLETLSTKQGFYRFTYQSSQIYPCAEPSSCQAGTVSGAGGSPCEQGAQGPLCATCSKHYYRQGRSCVACREGVGPGGDFLPYAIGSLVLVVGCVLGCGGLGLRKRGESQVVDTAAAALTAPGTQWCRRIGVLVSSMQTVVFLRATNQALGGSSLPRVYDKFLDVMYFLSLDVTKIFPWSCVEVLRDWEHSDTVVFWVVAPIGAGALCFVAANLCCRGVDTGTRMLRAALHAAVVGGIFLGLPLVLRSLAEALKCKGYDQGDPYAPSRVVLAAAPSESCATDKAEVWRLVALGGLVLYSGLAGDLFFLVAQSRRVLNPPHPPHGQAPAAALWEAFVVRKRCESPRVIFSPFALAFAVAKRPSRWWYDFAVALPARVALAVGVLWLSSLAVFHAATLAIALFVVLVEAELRPFHDPGFSSFSLANSWLVVLVLVAFLLVDSSASSTNLNEVIGYALTGLHGGLCVLSFVPFFVRSALPDQDSLPDKNSWAPPSPSPDPAYHDTSAIDLELARRDHRARAAPEQNSTFSDENPMHRRSPLEVEAGNPSVPHSARGEAMGPYGRSTAPVVAAVGQERIQPKSPRRPRFEGAEMNGAVRPPIGHLQSGNGDPGADFDEYFEVTFDEAAGAGSIPDGTTEKQFKNDWNGI